MATVSGADHNFHFTIGKTEGSATQPNHNGHGKGDVYPSLAPPEQDVVDFSRCDCFPIRVSARLYQRWYLANLPAALPPYRPLALGHKINLKVPSLRAASVEFTPHMLAPLKGAVELGRPVWLSTGCDIFGRSLRSRGSQECLCVLSSVFRSFGDAKQQRPIVLKSHGRTRMLEKPVAVGDSLVVISL